MRFIVFCAIRRVELPQIDAPCAAVLCKSTRTFGRTKHPATAAGATAATHAAKCQLITSAIPPVIPSLPPSSPRIPTPPPAIPTVSPTAPRLLPSVRRLLPIVPRLRRRVRIRAMLARRIRKLAAFVLVLRLANARCAAHALALCAVPFAMRTLCVFCSALLARALFVNTH